MRTAALALASAALLLGAFAAPAQPTGALPSTMTVGGADSAPRPRDPHVHRELYEARILAITPRPRLSADCSPAQERAAQSDLETAAYRLKCR